MENISKVCTHLSIISGVQLVVKFQKDGSTYVTFESSNKKKVDWDAISDDEYKYMMLTAIDTIAGWYEKYIGNETADTNTRHRRKRLNVTH